MGRSTPLSRLQHYMHGVPRRFASVKVGSILIIAVFVFSLVAAFFPYSEAAGLIRRAGEAFGLDVISQANELGFQERFESPPFIALVFALALSLCLSLYFRVRNEILRWHSDRAARSAEAIDWGRHPMVAVVCQELRRHGYRVHAVRAKGESQIRGAKGGSGVMGSVLFHIAILLVLAAVALSALASFRASVKLTEGQAFDARSDLYGAKRAGPWYTPPEQPVTFRLVRVEPGFETDGATTAASIVQPTLEGTISRFLEPTPVYINHGLEHAGVTIHQGRETGYAPYVVIENAAGERLLTGYTRLATAAGAERESFLDYVYLKERNASVELELLPDAAYRDGAYVSRSAMLKKPVLRVVVRESGEAVFEQFVPMTRSASAGGYTVFFGDVRRWSQIDVVDARGVTLLMVATLLGSLGLALRLLNVRRHVAISLPAADGSPHGAMRISGSSEKFHKQFEEELRNIRAGLTGRLAALAGNTHVDLTAAGTVAAARD